MSKKYTTKYPTYITTSKSPTYFTPSGSKKQTLKNLKSSESSLFPNEEYFKIIHELLRAKLLHVAPNFYSNYCRKLLEKILKEGKKMIKTASPGKFKTLKGQPSLPKYPKRLALIRDAVLSDKSPQELYDWWSQKIDAYGMSAQDWHFTWPEIECGFYNQLTHLSNSFNKYPPHDNVEGQHELQALTEYLKLVEEILQTTISGEEKPNYMLMMDAQIAYIRLTQIRHTGSDECEYMDYFKDVLDKTINKPIILWPLSINPTEANFAKFYGIPIVPFLSVYKLVHLREYLKPCNQLEHDIKFHSNDYITLDLLSYSNEDELKKEFLKRTHIIEAIINSSDIEDPRYTIRPDLYSPKIKLIDIFFDDVHESKFRYYKNIVFKQKKNINWPEQIGINSSILIDKRKTRDLSQQKTYSLLEADHLLYDEYILRVSQLYPLSAYNSL